jgi:hypothetical protein
VKPYDGDGIEVTYTKELLIICRNRIVKDQRDYLGQPGTNWPNHTYGEFHGSGLKSYVFAVVPVPVTASTKAFRSEKWSVIALDYYRA